MPKEIKTFVFFDIETTGLPEEEFSKTKITELALIACSKVELLNHTGKGKRPRVQHKLTICLNPMKLVSLGSSRISGKKISNTEALRPYKTNAILIVFNHPGLDNYNLEHEKSFTSNTGELLKTFLNQLQAPICLVAHNGFKFDYPILRKQLNTEVNVYIAISRYIFVRFSFTIHWHLFQNVDCVNSIYCVDSLEIFRTLADAVDEPEPVSSLLATPQMEEKTTATDLEILLESDIRARQSMNEKTPSSRKIKADQGRLRIGEIEAATGVRIGTKSKRELFPSNGKSEESATPKKRITFKLVDIYTRLHGIAPAIAHNAEEDANILMKCCLVDAKRFIECAEKSAVQLATIKPLGQKWKSQISK